MNKKWLVFILSAMVCTPVFSKDDLLHSSELQVIASLLADSPDFAKGNAEKLIKKNSDNTDLIAAIGSIYLKAGKVDDAAEYFRRAQRCKRISTKAINLGGDIAIAKNNVDSAKYYYERSIYFDRKDPDGYYKYANLLKTTDMSKAVEVLTLLKKNRPDLNVDKQIAEIYYTANDIDKAIAGYETIGVDSLDDRELMQYALSQFIKKEYEKSLQVATIGHQRNAEDPIFNRLLLYNNTELQHYDEAIKNADDLLNHSKDAKLQYQDYIYYGYALNGLGRTQDAIDQFNVALQKNSDLFDINKQVSEAYARIQDFDNAIKYYRIYIGKIKDDNETKAYEMYQLGRLYWRKGITNSGKVLTPEQTQALEEAGKTFGEVAALRPNSYLGYYWQGKVNTLLDPEYKKGLARPYFMKAVELLEKSGGNKDQLIECYKQLAYYYYLQKEGSTAIVYAKKIEALDPDDDFAKQLIANAQTLSETKSVKSTKHTSKRNKKITKRR